MKTPEERLEIYEKMLKLAIKDRKWCIGMNIPLYGLCSILSHTDNHWFSPISSFPEIYSQKPDVPFDIGYWFPTNPENTQRIEVIKNAIKQVKKLI